MQELVIVGAGPAGMTAAVYAARKGLRPLVLSEDIGGQANWSSSVENYMGFTDIGGSELMNRFREHMEAQRLVYESCRVTHIAPDGDRFTVARENGPAVTGRAVIFATGQRPRMLGVPGELEYRGKGVSYCSTCDGPLYRGAAVAVIGGGNAGLQAAYDLLTVEARVALITIEGITADQAVRDKVLGHKNLTVHEFHQVREIRGSRMVEQIVVAGPDDRETTLDVEGVFVEIGLLPNGEAIDAQVRRNEQGEIMVDCECRTNLPGLYAAGDVTTVFGKQIIIAAGEGAKAVLAAAHFLAFGS